MIITGSSSSGSGGGATSNAATKLEKEALTLETTILRNLHHTFVYQNQYDVAQKYETQIMSALKRSRAQLDQENAEIAMYQMVLEGTNHALAGLYPEIISKQESIIQTCLQCQKGTVLPRRSIPRIIVPSTVSQQRLQHLHNKRCSFSSTNSSGGHNYSISDLGESVETDSTKDDLVQLPPRRGRYPVFTSAETLQQQTLQHLAGVRGM
jgi:hypothetical protein